MAATPELEGRRDANVELRIGDIAGFVRHHGLISASILLLTVAAGAAVLLFSSPVYRSEVVLLPVSDEEAGSQLARMAGQFGGLASLAGIELPGSGTTQASLARLRSKELIADFIKRGSLLPILFAKDWDAGRKDWSDEPPSLEDAVKLFDEDVRTVFDDKDTGLVTLRIEWNDPSIASKWAAELVAMANEDLRGTAIEEARSSMKYLESQLRETSVVELQESIYRLMESETRKIMLASVRPEYAFRVVDSARTPDADDPVWPNNILVLLVSVLLGLALVFVLAVMRVRQARR